MRKKKMCALLASTVMLASCSSMVTVTVTCPGPALDDYQDCDTKAREACPWGFETIKYIPPIEPPNGDPNGEKSMLVRC
jgi:hypothetical protein